MASVTAFIILGDPHPNDNGISPEWLIELWEGNKATLQLKPINSKPPIKTIKDFYTLYGYHLHLNSFLRLSSSDLA